MSVGMWKRGFDERIREVAFPQAYDYIIYYDGKWYNARNGKTGEIEYVSNDKDDVFEYVKGLTGAKFVVVLDVSRSDVDSSLLDSSKSYYFVKDVSQTWTNIGSLALTEDNGQLKVGDEYFSSVRAYDYIVYKDDDGNVVVMDGKKGKVVYKSFDANDVMQNLISRLIGGEAIYVHSNVEIPVGLGTELVFPYEVHLISHGAKFILQDPGDNMIDYVKLAGDNSSIKGFVFDGSNVTSEMLGGLPRLICVGVGNNIEIAFNRVINGYNLYGFEINSPDESTVYGAKVHDNYFNGIRSAIMLHYSYGAVVRDNIIRNATAYAIQLYKYDEYCEVRGNYIEFTESTFSRRGIYLGHTKTATGTSNNHIVVGNKIINADFGIYIPLDTHGHIVANNFIVPTSGGIGVHIETVHDFKIVNNTIYGSEGSGTGIYVVGASTNYVIEGNLCKDLNIGIIVTSADTYTYSVVRGNHIIGYDSTISRGIYTRGCNNVIVSDNVIVNHYRGLWLGYNATDSSNVFVKENRFYNNSQDIYNQSTGTNIVIERNYLTTFTGTTSNVTFRDNIGYDEHTIPTSAPAVPKAGSIYFDTSTGDLYVYDGTTWKKVTLT